MINLELLKSVLASPEDDGLYSLKRIFQSSNRAEKDQPSKYIKKQSTINLIKYLESQALNSTNGNNQQVTRSERRIDGGDTFVHRKMVYDYAQSISPEFLCLVVDVFDHMLHSETEKAESLIKVYSGHQPNHPNSLPALLKKPRSQCKPYFDYLRQRDIVGVTYAERLPQAIYHQGINGDGLVTGKHGNTLLFSDNIESVFPGNLSLFE